MIHSFWLFDRHSDCVYRREWNQPVEHSASQADDIAKLIFGIVLSMRNVSRKLLGDDSFTYFTTSRYRLHYFESPSTLKMVMVTDPDHSALAPTLQEIYATLYLEYVVRNPLCAIDQRAAENAGPVDNELFTVNLDALVQSLPGFAS